MLRAPSPDQALRLRTVVTLGAGALIAGASVAFLVWLLVYTGFEGSEARPVVPRADETAANPAKKQHGEGPGPALGGPDSAGAGDEAGESDDEPGVNPLLLSPYSASPTLLLPMGPRPGAGNESDSGDDPGSDEGGGGEPPDGSSPENG